MKKFIPYLLFSAATLHTVIGISPVVALGCDSQTPTSEIVCKEGDIDCQKKVIESRIN